ncbi:MAG TPA: tRNA (adenosine(37)-N6)-threonylcarbamoyltransferase complex ATPase subunit type 1 TsaE [Candidatus Acidoferrum sp.]|nr:tRNA (adenosine(37)-N6)-threonylcarbamoyltransferase complex ATPase subunit type 1 TsaE [Candidatus Acidoferrum sp.]
MAILTSKSPEETLAIGEAWGREAQRGWVIGLSGDLGAGKTQLVKGIALGLGSKARVHSPTFALLNEYDDGRERLFHLDLYRLNSPDDVASAGLEEYLVSPGGVAVVEWIERWLGEHGALNIEHRTSNEVTRLARIETISETERRITYEDSGA